MKLEISPTYTIFWTESCKNACVCVQKAVENQQFHMVQSITS